MVVMISLCVVLQSKRNAENLQLMRTSVLYILLKEKESIFEMKALLL